MATTCTVTKGSKIQTAHAATNLAHYHRFDPNISTINLQDSQGDNGAFSSTSVTFSAGSGTITPTFPTNIKQLHVSLTNGHYYRFESSGQVTVLQNGDATGDFGTVSFTTV